MQNFAQKLLESLKAPWRRSVRVHVKRIWLNFRLILEYPEIELHKLSIQFLTNLVTSENKNAARTFIMICLSFTEIIHSLLSSMRRWIRLANQKPIRKKCKIFDDHLREILKFGIISFSHIIGCLDLTEDLKEQIFRYENRFQVFFLRLIEVVCHAIKLGFESNLCKKSIAGCLKNLFVLLTQFGSDYKQWLSFLDHTVEFLTPWALAQDKNRDLIFESVVKLIKTICSANF